MSAQIKALTKAITKLTAKKGNKNVNPNTKDGEKGNRRRRRPLAQLKKLHPIGINHDSKSFSHKTDKHKDNATWNNCIGGSTYWPAVIHVAIEQQDHTRWKGKLAPTN